MINTSKKYIKFDFLQKKYRETNPERVLPRWRSRMRVQMRETDQEETGRGRGRESESEREGEIVQI